MLPACSIPGIDGSAPNVEDVATGHAVIDVVCDVPGRQGLPQVAPWRAFAPFGWTRTAVAARPAGVGVEIVNPVGIVNRKQDVLIGTFPTDRDDDGEAVA